MHTQTHAHTQSRQKALAYAQRSFPALAALDSAYLPHLQQLMGCLLWVNRLHQSPYAHFTDPERWNTAAECLLQDGCTALGLPRYSSLAIAVEAGAAAAPVLLKMASVAASSNRSWDQEKQLLVDVPLPAHLRFHSVFSCPVSRELGSASNPPVLLKCGHVISKASMLRLPRSGTRFKCPTCPAESSAALELILG